MNVILIVADTLRADHLSYTGYGRKTSPCIDELAAEGIVFENYMSTAGHTIPAFTSIFTGLNPFTHGVTGTLWCLPDVRDHVLEADTPTIATILSNAGYHTAAIDNLINFRFHPGWFVKGFDEYINPGPSKFAATLLGERINEVFFNWLKGFPRKKNFFLFMHYWDTHQSFNQPEKYRKLFKIDDLMHTMKTAPDGTEYVPRWGIRKMLADRWWLNRINLYDGEVRYLDDCLGKVVAKLKKEKLYDDTMIIFTGDHGEDMFEHHSFMGHREVYQSTIAVPLIIKPPMGMRIASHKTDELCCHDDILPAVLDAAGVKTAAEPGHGKKKRRKGGRTLSIKGEGIKPLDGKSIIPVIIGKKKKIRDYCFATGCYFDNRDKWYSIEACVRSKEWKLIKRAKLPDRKFKDEEIIGLLVEFDENKHGYYATGAFRKLPRTELYNLEKDPHERTDLAKENPKVVKKLSAAFRFVEDSGYFLKGTE